jgi:hypothetical protein
MKRVILLLIIGLFLISLDVFAQDDVLIDESGNVTVGTSATDGNLEVIGASDEDGVVGSASGVGAGVYGENTTSGNSGLLGDSSYGVLGINAGSNFGVRGYNSLSQHYGMLGGPSNAVFGFNNGSGVAIYGHNSSTGIGVQGYNSTSVNFGYLGTSTAGVFGSSAGGWAGDFQGDVRITDDLTVNGTIIGGETDPVFNAWDKSTGITILEGQITNLSHFINADETDQVFAASPAFAITSGQISNWDTAYSTYDTTNDAWTGTGTVYTTSGRVGIGTASPAAGLEIKGDGWPDAFLILDANLDTAGSGVRLHKGGVVKWHIINQGTDNLFSIRRANAYGAPVFSADYATGYVGIGTIAPGVELDVAGTARVSVIEITSDRRFKKNISTIDNALEKVSRLRGVAFDWKKDEFPDHGFKEGTSIGLIAQEVEDVLPEVVSRNGEDGARSVEYSNLVAVLIEAVKELKDNNEELQERIQALEEGN